MTQEERRQMIESYGAAYDRLVEAIGALPRRMWTYRPASGEWTIHEILIHIADSEANSFIRARRFIAEPGSTVMAYDQDLWAVRLDYHNRNIEEALALFRELRRSTYSLVRSLPESTWSNTVSHPENGVMSMDDWLRIYEAHVPGHIAQMQRVHDAWLQAAAPEEAGA
ncbi:MAG TPA: DinB family protein [Candidatus Kapabacteria bacterium]|nr:DinB family protein [Candidatus Kapabacteria bacterium]